MQKGWLFVFCVLLLGGCSEREKVTMYPSKNVTQQYQEVHGWIGVLTGMFEVTSSGISAAILFGFIAALIFKPKGKVD